MVVLVKHLKHLKLKSLIKCYIYSVFWVIAIKCHLKWQDNSTWNMVLFCFVAQEGCSKSTLEQFSGFRILTWHWMWHIFKRSAFRFVFSLDKPFTSSHWISSPVNRIVALQSSHPMTLVMFHNKRVCHIIKAVLFHPHWCKVRLGFAVLLMQRDRARQTPAGLSSPLQHMGSVGSF